MVKALEIGIGIVLGLGAIGGVLWFTFRNPSPCRPVDSTTHMNPNPDAEYWVQNFRDDGHGGHF